MFGDTGDITVELAVELSQHIARYRALLDQLDVMDKEFHQVAALKIMAEATNNKRQLVAIENQSSLMSAQRDALLQELYKASGTTNREGVELLGLRLDVAEDNLNKLAEDLARSDNLMAHARRLQEVSGEDQNLDLLDTYAQAMRRNYETQLQLLKEMLPC